MNQGQWKSSEVARTRDLYESGSTDGEIAVVLGRTKASVSNARQKFGIRRPLRKYVICRPWLPEELNRAKEFYARGASRAEMCATFERSRIAIKRLVIDHDLQRDPRFSPDPEQFNTPGETWRVSPLAPRYAISSIGRVASMNPGKIGVILTPWVDGDGYSHVTLRVGDKLKRIAVHKLVLTAFHGCAPTARHQSAHGDGDPSNNRDDNLRWATPKENQADRRKHGRAERRDDGKFVKVHRVDWHA